MKITEHIEQAKGKTLFSLEILPPVKGQDINCTFKTLDPLVELKPAFIDVTYHRQEYIYKQKENGLLKKYSVRKRPGTVAICSAIQNHYKIDAVPHLICGGFTKEDTEDALIDLNFLGIDNVLVLRGDPIKTEKTFVPEPGGHAFANELVQQVVGLNHGKYLDDELQETHATDFCIGVAGYPEKHFESANLSLDMHYLKQKVDLGANYIVTQMFYDNQKYFDFVTKCRENGIQVPIIPGIKPLTAVGQLSSIPKNFYIDLPEALVQELLKADCSSTISQIGLEWSVNQCKELIKFGVPALHFYTMSNSKHTKFIAQQLF
ncbi:methylenetetrahydrofolate reductase [NAD(P)H] [Flavobacterium agricola]|uniref:Methylenetetrahydrofolate reductase n=1 Tax=Flavobacterium agricola TaxID=2870839 RepID=A0ABY6LZD0_9FLAO|nr:methylenetetrahydrofolate reductase [NAD(P)H] [Flavobacterium agricola]UYW01367.1 methylenetetrahydrofolate reductase [NAD(P)H] [Flavobacterium agricola]